MWKNIKIILKLLKRSYGSWEKNGAYAKSATIAYYALFSLPSLLIIVVNIAGYFFGRKAVQGRLNRRNLRIYRRGHCQCGRIYDRERGLKQGFYSRSYFWFFHAYFWSYRGIFPAKNSHEQYLECCG